MRDTSDMRGVEVWQSASVRHFTNRNGWKGFWCYVSKLKQIAILVLAIPFALSAWGAAPQGSIVGPLTLLLSGNSCNTVTTKVTDINGIGYPNPQFLTNFNDTLFFTTDRNASGVELWKSDGTSSGTTLVKDINPNAGDSHPAHLTDVNGTLLVHQVLYHQI